MKAITKKLPVAARLVLGLVFLVLGLNGFLHFLPQPPMPASAAPFMTGLVSAGYFFPLLKGVEVAAGLMLVTGVLVPFALTLLAPVIVNIAAFHLALAPGGFGLVALVLAAEVYLAWTHREAFAPLFQRGRSARPVQHVGRDLQQAA